MARGYKAGMLGRYESVKLSGLLAFKLRRKLTVGFFGVLFAIYYSLFAATLFAFDRTNVPLKNWGGFSINRSWIYDALEKIVLAGLADEVFLNTKPLSRVEAARIVAQAVRRIELDESGDYNHRGYMDDLLYQLVKEFGPELAEMGVRTPLNREATTEFFGVKAFEHAQFGIDFSNRSQRIVNNFGRRLSKGANANSSLDGRFHVGDFLSFYYQPVFSWGEASQVRLQSGYAKLAFSNLELEGGRDSVWWGPGFRGSMSISNNAPPLNIVRIGSAEPFRLPWVLSHLGAWKLVTFVQQLEKDRELPYAMLSGTRISLAPSRFVELGFNRMFQFGGRGHQPSFGTFMKLLFFQPGREKGGENKPGPDQINNVMSFDATLRIPEVDRYILIARDISLYFDFGWDDTKFGLIVPDKPGGIYGAYLTGIFGDPKLDLRIEYAKTSEIEFTHGLYISGYAYKHSVLSHFIGTKGSDLYVRLTRWVNPDLLLGFQLSTSKIGPTVANTLGLPREKRDSLGVDASYRISDRSSIFLGYDLARVKDRGSVAGRSGKDNFFRIEFTYTFGKSY